ncbi:hypothetical protein EVAR_52200_1 [Eumeta japonica]|uniref:Uncharacterized protein n=1 Tax=Eumeta variegata TaxID=151549 RepID=A0A4C1Z2R4_EUMVA|nr:hypothetical protein EVAR_52200_1 [Eumeta japonica]
MPRVPGEDDIINILLDDIPFDELQPQFDSDFDSDDDIPLSNLCTAFANSIPLPTQTEVVQSKWRKHFKMEKPDEYTRGGGVLNNIVELKKISHQQSYSVFSGQGI